MKITPKASIGIHSVFTLLTLILICFGAAHAADPVCDIRANGSGDAVSIRPGTKLSVTLSLEAGDSAGTPADWWIAAYTSSQWRYLDISSGTLAWEPGIAFTFQGGLGDLPAVEILNVSDLAEGTHIFIFAVDTAVNGTIGETDNLYYDYVTVTVEDTVPAVMINEVVAKAAADGEDWIEFYVSGTETINLSDYTVVDDNEERDPAALPSVILAPGEFYVVLATDEAPEDGSAYVPFKLGSDDSVSLFKENNLIDKLDWADGEAPIGYSYGRYPDGSLDCQTLEMTPSARNEPFDFFSEDTVEDVYITISETDWNSLLASPLLEEYHSASITYRNITLDDVAFRTKGSSSLQAVAGMNSTRFSFKVDMNYYVDGQKLLGMKKINLNNNYKDPSYMRERIAYDMLRFLDVPTPRLSYVNLYINGSLHGLYTLVEQVDSEFLEKNFDNPEGDLYKPDGTGSDLLWMGADFAAYSGVELKTNEDSTDNAAFINMVNELNNGSDIKSVIDVDEVLRYFAVSTALSNLDSYQGTLAHNYYLYEQDGVFSIIPWDFNESFGTFRMGCQDSNTMISLYIDEPTSGTLADRPLIARLLKNEAYKTAYHGYVEDLINTFNGVMDPGAIASTIEDTRDMISEHVNNDPTAFYSYAEFVASLGYTMIGDIFGLQAFVGARTENMIDQLSGSQPIEGDGSGSCGSTIPGPPPRGMP